MVEAWMTPGPEAGWSIFEGGLFGQGDGEGAGVKGEDGAGGDGRGGVEGESDGHGGDMGDCGDVEVGGGNREIEPEDGHGVGAGAVGMDGEVVVRDTGLGSGCREAVMAADRSVDQITAGLEGEEARP
jgi:hypothetical protein